MESAISIEGIAKRFRIRHQANGAPYSTFRDAAVESIKSLGARLIGRGRKSGGPSEEEFWALTDVSFEVKEGEKIGIIGRNGAGKSTLLKIISRILEPTSGRIRIRGRIASLLEVGTGFHPELTGRENIFFNGAILGMTRAEVAAKFDEIVDFAEVSGFLDTPVKYFSSGMYVRLGFAVAASLESEILIIDEILAVGDARFQKKCLGKLQDIGRNGRTVMFVSHNMSSVLQFTNRVILLQDGRVLRDCDSETGAREYLRINEESSQAVNLASRVPWFFLDQVSFDQANMQVGFNQPLRFKLGISLERAAKEVEILLVIVNSIGARLITARTVLPGIDPGSRLFELAVTDHRLIPGTYLISMTIREKAETLFHKEQMIIIELVADDIDDPFLLPLAAKGKDRFGAYCPIQVISDGA